MPQPDLNLMALDLFKALADETRLLTVLLLREHQELCVCDLIEVLQLSQPKISRHLALLREVQVLQSRREGVWIYYRLNVALPTWALDVIDAGVVAQRQLLATLAKRLRHCC